MSKERSERWESPRCTSTPKNTAMDILTQLYEEEAPLGSAVLRVFSVLFVAGGCKVERERGFSLLLLHRSNVAKPAFGDVQGFSWIKADCRFHVDPIRSGKGPIFISVNWKLVQMSNVSCKGMSSLGTSRFGIKWTCW